MAHHTISCGPLYPSDPDFSTHLSNASTMVAARLGAEFMWRGTSATKFRLLIWVRKSATDYVDVVGTAYTDLRAPGLLVLLQHKQPRA